MAAPHPTETISEGDMVLIRARVRKVWHDAVVMRVPIRDGTAQRWQQLSVPPAAVVARETGPDAADVPAVTW